MDGLNIILMLIIILGYLIVIKPFFRIKNKIQKELELDRYAVIDVDVDGRGFIDIDGRNMLTEEEMKLLQSNDIPTDEHILKYYKMYCKKFEMTDVWTTIIPMTFDEFEEKAKRPTKVIHPKEGDSFSFMIAGGYQYIIRKTCDVFIGIAPYQTMLRNVDYAKLVEEDDKKLNETITENTEV